MTEMSKPSKPTQYWRSNLRLICILLGSWGLVTFVPAYFAKALSDLMIFGWPFPFWVAAFGAPTAFLVIVGVYAWRMEKLDQQRRAKKLEQT
jgi:putative solute:sodium symporter small subunit